MDFGIYANERGDAVRRTKAALPKVKNFRTFRCEFGMARQIATYNFPPPRRIKNRPGAFGEIKILES